MEKSHDELRAEMKIRIASALPAHGDAAAAARDAGVPKTSLYTWMGTAKKAIPDAVDAYFLARVLRTTVEELVAGDEGKATVLAWVAREANRRLMSIEAFVTGFEPNKLPHSLLADCLLLQQLDRLGPVERLARAEAKEATMLFPGGDPDHPDAPEWNVKVGGRRPLPPDDPKSASGS